MQQALQNPHYKKIWEKVIMNRHPEAQSLEEALEMEAQKNGSILYDADSKRCVTVFECNYTDEESMCLQCISDSGGSTLIIYQKVNSKQEIFGRPITLEDVAQLWYATCIDTNSKKGYAKIGIYDRLLIPFVNWQLTKPLHEQTLETWETIANLID